MFGIQRRIYLKLDLRGATLLYIAGIGSVLISHVVDQGSIPGTTEPSQVLFLSIADLALFQKYIKLGLSKN